MKNNVRKNLLATLSLSAVCALSVGALGVNNASAETETPTADILVKGAAVYVGSEEEVGGVDKSGIRFQILAKKSVVESGAEIGALLLPADMTEATELTLDTVVIQNDKVEGEETVTKAVLDSEKWHDSEYEGYVYTWAYLYNFPVNDYNREILASAYVKGDTTTYSNTLSRSMAGVALAAENDNDDRAAAYIKKYHVNYYGLDGETEIDGLENVGVRYGSLIEKPADPTMDTHTFKGWYTDKECNDAFDFATMTVTGTTNLYSAWEKKLPFATSVSINGGTVSSTANLASGDEAASTTDWYYNKSTGVLTKTFSHQTGGSDFNDRIYFKDAQTGDFTFMVTATLGEHAGFEFTYNDGSAIRRFFIGRSGNTSIRVCIGDAATNVTYGYMGMNEETKFRFVKTSSEMKVYITNATTGNVERLAITITSSGITRNFTDKGVADSTDNQATVAAAFAKMFARHVAVGFTSVGGAANSVTYKDIAIAPYAFQTYTALTNTATSVTSRTINVVNQAPTTLDGTNGWVYSTEDGTLTNDSGYVGYAGNMALISKAMSGGYEFTSTIDVELNPDYNQAGFVITDGTNHLQLVMCGGSFRIAVGTGIQTTAWSYTYADGTAVFTSLRYCRKEVSIIKTVPEEGDAYIDVYVTDIVDGVKGEKLHALRLTKTGIVGMVEGATLSATLTNATVTNALTSILATGTQNVVGFTNVIGGTAADYPTQRYRDISLTEK